MHGTPFPRGKLIPVADSWRHPHQSVKRPGNFFPDRFCPQKAAAFHRCRLSLDFFNS